MGITANIPLSGTLTNVGVVLPDASDKADTTRLRRETSARKSLALRGIVLACALAIAGVPQGTAAASPSAEYGPEFEASFLRRCAATVMSEAACRRFMERMQVRLGYPAFLERASDAAEMIERLAESHLATASVAERRPRPTHP